MTTPTAISQRERILGGLWGSLVGDALGVPVEFKDRSIVRANPVTGMREYGTHRKPNLGGNASQEEPREPPPPTSAQDKSEAPHGSVWPALKLVSTPGLKRP
jgi:hypothetical protein